jgi:NADP-dependent 3-hydroxy acid dehydrogenase YdfG
MISGAPVRYRRVMSDPLVVLVTGCSTGIGHALARELHARGHRVVATARRPETLAELQVSGMDTLALDVTDPASIDAAVSESLGRAGRIDVLVNNAGINLFGPLLELSLPELRALFETNVLGLLAVTQAVLPHMADRKQGRIVNIGSVAGILPTPYAGAYCATKCAVHMLSEVLRMELKPFGIEVVVVQPGGVKSSIADSGSKGLERFQQESSRYHRGYEGIRKRAYASQDGPMPAEEFARELVEQALATPAPRPSARRPSARVRAQTRRPAGGVAGSGSAGPWVMRAAAGSARAGPARFPGEAPRAAPSGAF